MQVQLAATLRDYDPQREGSADQRLQAAGISPAYFPVHPWRWAGQAWAYSPELGRALETRIPAADIVHLHGVWLYPTMIASRICRRRRVPYVLSPCGALDPYGLRKRRLFKQAHGLLFEKQIIGGAASLHFTTAEEKDRAWTFGQKRPGAVIPCSVDLEQVPPAPTGRFRERFPEAAEKHLLLFFGRLHPKKRLDVAVEAFLRIAQRRKDVRLVVAGPEEGSGPPARKALAAAGLSNRATFTGLLSGTEKWDLLSESRLFLLPSEDENFGMSVLEAMAAGVPVLVSEQVGLSGAVQLSGAGQVVAKPAEVWAEAAGRLLDDPAACARMSQAGRRLAQEYSTLAVAARMKELYEFLLRKAR